MSDSMASYDLHLKFISSSAYDALRSSGIILPSERTLRDYSNWMPAKPGFSADVDRQLMKEVKIAEIPEYKKYVCLTFNEVKVKRGASLQQRKYGDCWICQCW